MLPNQGPLEEFVTYLIRNNMAGLKSMLISEGYTDISTPELMRLSMLKLIHDKKEVGMSNILEQHPDYQMVVDDYLAKHPVAVDTRGDEKAGGGVQTTPSELEKAGSHLSLGSMFSMHQQRDYLSMLCFLVLVFFAIKILKD